MPRDGAFKLSGKGSDSLKVGIVLGSVWATRKDERLSPCKLLIVQPIDVYLNMAEGAPLVAADRIGAGVGERVLVVSGSTAGRAAGEEQPPVDATIVGIIDDQELRREALASLKKKECQNDV